MFDFQEVAIIQKFNKALQNLDVFIKQEAKDSRLDLRLMPNDLESDTMSQKEQSSILLPLKQLEEGIS